MHYDIFNGDADGIIALLQLRLAEPKQSTLITGVKRDIKLLEQVVAKGNVTSVTVLDISMEKNLPELERLLAQGVEVFYCDHHRSGEIPAASNLEALINLDAEVCTSLLINEKLNGQFVHWAIAAAFGDNLYAAALVLAQQQNFTETEIAFLKELGTLINYNGYGASLFDLHIAPAELYTSLMKYENPFDLREDQSSPYYLLKKGYEQDYKNIAALTAIHDDDISRVFELPCEAWARRISGVFSNELANQQPDKAHAVLTLNANQDDYTVSVRAPLNNRTGADEVCTQFKTGGGRKAAAGINALALEDKSRFIHILSSHYM
ncbi:DHH family phosphoesterase [Photobacterium minamisatsumaniensis]|uniref:DHH family phosphoesterase n=1 Tax=Photobacterium minamisatsumaniensis TaxID=2910233 RepID=UPI003D0F8E9B